MIPVISVSVVLFLFFLFWVGMVDVCGVQLLLLFL